MIGYKLTTQDKKTRKGYPNETSWDIGVTHTAPGKGELCTDGWIHFYPDPYLAVLRNTVDANISNPRMFKVEAKGIKRDSLKCGCSELTILEEMEVPTITREQIIKFAELCAREAILCAKKVYKEEKWTKWADSWLSGEDRSVSYAASPDAAYATLAAYYASYAASSASASASATDAADASAYHASCAAADAALAAYYASCAAAAAALADDTIDFIKLIKEALKSE